ncbi:GNAT family N-acetyltransferase [Algoriphagus boritolerans]|uniref:Ribosomal protein S18 acetylase RimI n=1 Tax=Algoriphagus boritolerans DSM 17298 = JCM 18970 TaxID=1120964 RepID=A0A1H5XCD8_9BACT|nr:GNAT family N-acetyltransferase [Algoriphagus boritolerans]SEG09402.1 Ribosomal protein S18 acetylase RimI [Algoriphagus boritolerans DSM 17298 = JCM 18970]
MEINIRKAVDSDSESLWEIIEPIIREGKTYVFSPDSSKEKIMTFWLAAEKATYVAESKGEIVGTFFLKANQPDRGSHVVNAGYMVSPNARGKGIGQKMAEYSFEEAKRLGFKAMQFNFVVKSNSAAISLWSKLGFEIVGEVPEAFIHPELGLINVLVMYRKL